jgi:hypothetical protein
MRKVRFTKEHTVAIMREADREPVAVLAKRRGISEQSIYGSADLGLELYPSVYIHGR